MNFDDEFFDDYVNSLTGIGDWTQDKSYGGQMQGLDFDVRLITSIDAENRWRGSDLGANIVECIPDEMTREGWDITVQPSDGDDEPTDAKADFFPGQDPAAGGLPPGMMPPPEAKPPMPEIDDEGTEIAEALDGKCDELGVVEALLEALRYERAYGGSAILIGAQDGSTDLTQPLNEENITSVDWLNVFQGGREGEIVAWSYYTDPNSPKYGKPEIYMVRNIGIPLEKIPAPGQSLLPAARALPGFGALIFWVHESRLLVFEGMSVSRRTRVQMRGWGDSIFTRVDKVLSQFSQTWGGVATLMSEINLDVLKVDGLAVKMAGGDKVVKGNPLTNRARTIQRTKSLLRMLVIDKEEEVARMSASLAGVAEVLQQCALRVAAAAGMPVTLLFGQAPAGLNATGASDIRFFYDKIAARQKRSLLPQLKKLIRMILLSKEGPTEGVEPERWNIEFRALYQLTELESATLRGTQATTDVAYINAGVLSAEEVAASAFGGSEYSTERTIDFDGRAKMAAQDEKDRQAHAKAMQTAIANPPKAAPTTTPDDLPDPKA